ncbi:NAD(P)-binding domain-containing protein [soil metagenome]
MQIRAGQKVCVIGAGSSGIAACQVLSARGIEFDCFEKGSEVGGNWRFMNDNGLSSAYRSLHINTSRGQMAYATYPMPDDYPDYPNHFQIAEYFDSYVDHFGFRDRIRFKTGVTNVAPASGGGYELSWRDEEGNEGSEVYAAVMVANGHHWDARWPEPAFPGSDEFSGQQIHVHDYKEADELQGTRVLVLGIGKSATELAVEASRVGEASFLAMRRGAHIVPKYIFGKPTDETASPLVSLLPMSVQRTISSGLLRLTHGKVTDYGLPEPDHKLYEAHPTVSSDLLPRIGHGDVKVKPNIERFSGGRTVRFVDGSEEEIDTVVYCTGYKITFQFFDEDFITARDNRLPLYRRVVDPSHPGVYFIGLLQPLGAIMPLSEAQSEWIGDVFEGKTKLPSVKAMRNVIAREDERMARRYVASKRHTIQVDFHPYLRTLQRERGLGNGASRVAAVVARRSHELRAPAGRA